MSKQQLMQLKESHPGVPVVCYINSSAEVKAESDVVCTSANAVQVVNALDHKQIIFVPDQYLAANVAQHTDKEIIPFEGSCEVHRQFTREHVLSQRQKEPALVTLAHPECPVEVTSEVDIVGSTSKMVQWNEGGPETDHAFIATEGSMVENIQVERPELNMHGPKFYCPHMQLITLAKVLEALEQERIEVNVNPEVRQGALNSLERMLELVA
jgi:quinolinate synthase